jgi:hypothetical protein
MQKVETLLNEQLLRLGNPKFWGKNFHIKIKGGSPIEGILVRVNWTMRYGKVIGNLTVKTNTAEKKIDLEDVQEISQSLKIEAPKFIPIPKEEPILEVKPVILERKVEPPKIEPAKIKIAEVVV